MSAPLAPCPSCMRHVQVTEPACPFCAAPLAEIAPPTFDAQAVPRRVAHFALAVGASLALGACPSPSSPAGVYGAAPLPSPAQRGDASAMRVAPDAPAAPPAPTVPPGTVTDDGSRGEVYGAPPRPR